MAKPIEMSLSEIVGLLWRHLRTILGCAVGAAVVAVLVCLVLPKSYRASTDILILTPAFKESEADFSELVPESFTVQTCNELLRSAGLLAQVFEESGVRDAGKLTIEEFTKKLYTRVRIEKETNYDIVHSPVITLYAAADTPEMATNVVDTWAELFVTEAKKVQSEEAGQVYEFIKEEFSTLEGSLKEAEEKLRDFEIENNIDQIEIEKEKKELLLTEFQAKAAEAEVAIKAAEEKLDKLETEKELTPETRQLKKAIPDDPLWLNWLAQGETQGAKPSKELEKVWLETEEVNPTRLAIEEEIVVTQGELHSRKGELEMTLQKIAKIKSDIDELQQKLAKASMENTRLTRDVEDYTTTHKLLVTERDKAQIAKGRTMGDVRRWSEPVLPEEPTYPRKKSLVAAVAFVLGLAVSSGYVLYRYGVLQTPEKVASA